MICSTDDEWIAGIKAYLPKESKILKHVNNSNTNNNENDTENTDSILPRIFKQTSWRKMLNL